jgi:predicted nucleic acid-binding protein
MNLYAESSAVLAWLFSEREGTRIYPLLSAAQAVVSSDITLVECDRALLRATALGRITESDMSDLRREFASAVAKWTVLRISPEIIERARRPFPTEPIRALDALHIASALSARSAVPALEILSLDDRIRNAAHQLGLKLQPQ